MCRMENVIGRSVHLTPSGIDFDEHVFQLGQGTVVRAAGSLIFPRCFSSCDPLPGRVVMVLLQPHHAANARDQRVVQSHLCICTALFFDECMRWGWDISDICSSIVCKRLSSVVKARSACRQLPVEEGEKLVKFKAQRFGLKALW